MDNGAAIWRRPKNVFDRKFAFGNPDAPNGVYIEIMEV
jgi:hypothetical protein